MVEAKMIIKNETGLHARPAANLVKEASNYPCALRIRKGNREVSLQSILGVLSLGIAKGDEVIIIADGPNEEEILQKVVAFINCLEG
ncbi:MAG TPA: HPr family phosphocarrier protein [Firmicutes bacterium]|jgi:phosphotransferase system HPr (HPr) family protein|nr:HPr family phosphocarrier protein [Bacillota bacterium]HBR34361.1 HPr family phosphocarrier protein [Bacillota bacterium]